MLTGIMAAENVYGADHNIWDTKDADAYLEAGSASSAGESLRGGLSTLWTKKSVSVIIGIFLLTCILW